MPSIRPARRVNPMQHRFAVELADLSTAIRSGARFAYSRLTHRFVACSVRLTVDLPETWADEIPGLGRPLALHLDRAAWLADEVAADQLEGRPERDAGGSIVVEDTLNEADAPILRGARAAPLQDAPKEATPSPDRVGRELDRLRSAWSQVSSSHRFIHLLSSPLRVAGYASS